MPASKRRKSSRDKTLSRLGFQARKAVAAKDWRSVNSYASEMVRRDGQNAEGWFLGGLAAKAAARREQAVKAFGKALQLDPKRYDAAIELAFQHWSLFRHGEAADLIGKYEIALSKSPYYLDLAASTYSRLGLHSRAWPLYRKAVELQPEVDQFKEKLAACAVLVGKIDEARAIYTDLLERFPSHQRAHYELSKLGRAKDPSHVTQMKKVLAEKNLPPARNIFLYYALGKELEDLECWDEAFHFYQLGGNAAAAEAGKAGYRVDSDIAVIERITEVCNADWLARENVSPPSLQDSQTPIFIVGLPRTGTTLTERILASHAEVESADETFFLRIVLRRLSGVQGPADITPAVINAVADKDPALIAQAYMDAVGYRLEGKPRFIDKFPENYLYLGFIARAFPEARIIHLRRNPMDACFAMYKQSYFRQAYTLDDLGRYYLAYHRLFSHWRSVLGDRLIEVEYETLVSDLEGQVRLLLDRLGLEFQQSCIDFHLNQSPSATASTVQVREKAHTRSVNRWKEFERQLQPLREHLENNGISI